MKKSILFVGHSFYHTFYLRKELRKIGWKADLINIDSNNNSSHQDLYHGEDFKFDYKEDLEYRISVFINAICNYEIFHFSNVGGIYFLKDYQKPTRFYRLVPLIKLFIRLVLKDRSLREQINVLLFFKFLSEDSKGSLKISKFGFWIYRNILGFWLFKKLGTDWDLKIAKSLGIKFGYSNTGCLDGVLKSSFEKWGPENTCQICKWNSRPDICSDKINAEWGSYRNKISDYMFNIGSNKVDYNNSIKMYEAPWFYCLDSNVWNTDLLVPSNYKLNYPEEIVKVYHSVGDFENRTTGNENINIKCTHIYLKLIKKFQQENLPVDLLFFHGIPNKILRYYQVQCDIVVDMLTYGFFGANIREALMLGKPAVCFLRQTWLDEMSKEIPDYVNELPIISATPDTIETVLRELILNKSKRDEIGKRSREFAVKWHGSVEAARHFDTFLTHKVLSMERTSLIEH